ncbi:MAG: FecR domain-containing protein [Bacteroidota bacterium]
MDKDFDKDNLLGRWLGGSLSPEEEAALRQRPDFAAYEELVRAVDELAAPEFDGKASLARLKEKRTKQGGAAGAKERTKGNVRRLRPAHWAGIAASLLLLLSLWFLWHTSPQNFTAAAATTERAELPDGSTIRLNAVSELGFDASPTARTATLTGEAYFDVSQDGRPFTITTPVGEVTVLGTTFNVYSRDQEMRVTCTSGSVRVTFTQDTTKYTLNAGQSVSLLPDGQVNQVTIQQEEALDWLDGRSVFNNRPLSEVIAELERQFAINILLPDGINPAELIRTGFPNTDADAALEIVVSTLENIRYERSGNNVRLIQE